ncbi:hypothetical protein FA95DRAFT_1551741 [Auriscalpium vulgare]|uniref:Uncharacterized protein n=1 Tax=Auriscalpium vulgare TaxID=40419 RepID=A0ACB8SCI9_9AGAM|nr:hypothetical protein FA95DRAFT_1551741 [Auriscalpium vulgare]
MHTDEIQVAALDEEIERRRKSLRDLRGYRNEHTAISHLLPEILSQIFRLSCAQAEEESNGLWNVIAYHRRRDSLRKRYRGAWQAILLSHVSRRWRGVARDDPHLWATIFIPSEKWCVRMLARSKDAPLQIRLTLPSDKDAARPASRAEAQLRSARRVFQHIPRIEHLTLNCPPGAITESALRLLCTPAPSMRTFHVSNLLRIAGPIPRPTGTLPDDLFGGAAKLTELRVTDYEINWTSTLFMGGNIVRLAIARNPKWKESSMNNLLDLLARMPRLRSLDLQSLIPSVEPTGEPLVELPSLVEFCLIDDLQDCLNLVKCIKRIPKTCIMHIQTNESGHPPALESNILEMLQFAAPFCEDTRTMGFTGYSSADAYYGYVACWPTVLCKPSEFLRQAIGGTSKFSLSFKGASSTVLGPLPRWLQRIATILPVGDVKTVSYEGVDQDDYHLASWPEVFARLEKTETFRVNSQMLAILLNLSVSHADPFAFLPNLHTFMFADVVLTAALFDKLKRFLTARTGAIKAIAFAYSMFLDAQIAELRQFVRVEMPGDQSARAIPVADLFGEDAVGETEFLDPHMAYSAAQHDVGLDHENWGNPFGDDDNDSF